MHTWIVETGRQNDKRDENVFKDAKAHYRVHPSLECRIHGFYTTLKFINEIFVLSLRLSPCGLNTQLSLNKYL